MTDDFKIFAKHKNSDTEFRCEHTPSHQEHKHIPRIVLAGSSIIACKLCYLQYENLRLNRLLALNAERSGDIANAINRMSEIQQKIIADLITQFQRNSILTIDE